MFNVHPRATEEDSGLQTIGICTNLVSCLNQLKTYLQKMAINKQRNLKKVQQPVKGVCTDFWQYSMLQ